MFLIKYEIERVYDNQAQENTAMLLRKSGHKNKTFTNKELNNLPYKYKVVRTHYLLFTRLSDFWASSSRQNKITIISILVLISINIAGWYLKYSHCL